MQLYDTIHLTYGNSLADILRVGLAQYGLDISSKKETDKVVLVFKDNGMGIDLKKQATRYLISTSGFILALPRAKGLVYSW